MFSWLRVAAKKSPLEGGLRLERETLENGVIFQIWKYRFAYISGPYQTDVEKIELRNIDSDSVWPGGSYLERETIENGVIFRSKNDLVFQIFNAPYSRAHMTSWLG